MDALDYPIEHFEQMARLAIALKASSAQILEHHYHYHAVGSWYTIVRHREQLLRLVFDGRDREYVLEESAARKPPTSGLVCSGGTARRLARIFQWPTSLQPSSAADYAIRFSRSRTRNIASRRPAIVWLAIVSSTGT